MNNMQAWKNDYKKAAEVPPAEGDILKAVGGEDARLTLELTEGKQPFVYARAHVPCIAGQPVCGWVLQSLDSKSIGGWKCVLMPKAREEVLRRYPGLPSVIPIKALRVIRNSRSGNSILCEVAEWSETPAPADEVEPGTVGEIVVAELSS